MLFGFHLTTHLQNQRRRSGQKTESKNSSDRCDCHYPPPHFAHQKPSFTIIMLTRLTLLVRYHPFLSRVFTLKHQPFPLSNVLYDMEAMVFSTGHQLHILDPNINLTPVPLLIISELIAPHPEKQGQKWSRLQADRPTQAAGSATRSQVALSVWSRRIGGFQGRSSDLTQAIGTPILEFGEGRQLPFWVFVPVFFLQKIGFLNSLSNVHI